MQYEISRMEAGARLRYLTNTYSCQQSDCHEFLRLVNSYYYKEASGNYADRSVEEIGQEFVRIEAEIAAIVKEPFSVVDIGSGQGFVAQQLHKNGSKASRFFCFDEYQEPSAEMTFCNHERLNFEEALVRIGEISGRKVIYLCSVTHHMINPKTYYQSLCKVIAPGDLVVVVHEPCNDTLGIAGTLITSLIKKLRSIGKPKKKGYKSPARIASEKLLEDGWTTRRMPELAVRRIVDYQLGQKLDWIKLKIPRSQNEGFWNIGDMLGVLTRSKMEILKRNRYVYSYGELRLKSLIRTFLFDLKMGNSYWIIARKS